MKKENLKIVTAVFFTLVAAVGMPVHAKPFSNSFSGATTTSEEANTSGDLTFGSVSQGRSKGSFGTATQSGRSDLIDWNGATFCDSGAGPFTGVELVYHSASIIASYDKRGDQLYAVMSASPLSTLCVNFADGVSSVFEIHYDVIGGTGRFEGATGQYSIGGTATAVQPGHSGFTATSSGDITLIKKSRKSKKSHKSKKSKK